MRGDALESDGLKRDAAGAGSGGLVKVKGTPSEREVPPSDAKQWGGCCWRSWMLEDALRSLLLMDALRSLEMQVMPWALLFCAGITLGFLTEEVIPSELMCLMAGFEL